MKHFRNEFTFLAHFIVIYIAITSISTFMLSKVEASWFILIKNTLSAFVLLLFYLKSEFCSLESYFNDIEKVERRTEVRTPSKLRVILSPLHTTLRIPVQSINDSARGIKVVADSTIRGVVKKKQLLRIYKKRSFEIYQIVWMKEVSGQVSIGLLKVS
jgi:hypothetical protein